MITLELKADFKDVEKKLKQLEWNIQGRVVSAALNKVADKAKTQMTREIASEFNLQQQEIRSRLRVLRAKKDFRKWVVVLDPFASDRRKNTSLNLIRFVEKRVTLAEARRRQKSGTLDQLRFKIKRNGPMQTLDGAFIATNRLTGGTAVFARVGKERLPIQAKQTIDIPQMFNTRRINSRVVTRIRSDLPIEFERAIKAAMAGRI